MNSRFVAICGRMIGRRMYQARCQPDAPSTLDASMTSREIESSAAENRRYDHAVPFQILEMMTTGRAKSLMKLTGSKPSGSMRRTLSSPLADVVEDQRK